MTTSSAEIRAGSCQDLGVTFRNSCFVACGFAGYGSFRTFQGLAGALRLHVCKAGALRIACFRVEEREH